MGPFILVTRARVLERSRLFYDIFCSYWIFKLLLLCVYDCIIDCDYDCTSSVSEMVST